MTLRSNVRAAAAALVAAACAGCSMSADTHRAELEVPHFHEQLDAGQFGAIYEASSEQFKRVAKREEFIALLDAIHRKLGTVRSAKEQGWNANYTTSGRFVTLNYATTFEQGDGEEQFVYLLDKDSVSLVGYHISSNAMMIR